ncbi:uncharacterized protein LOC108487893 [Gossypium arboreum]|uniref:uncharacterized protein LOC108487893 n=1 Tax=Gossypium arboreum TaxID=29729 RepID=UPI0022F16575|nr:uncharacterized protein LOC108487893 [Gossypium arboreum]
MVSDALSRRAMTDLRAVFARLSLFDDKSLLAELQIEGGSTTDFRLNSEGVLCFRCRICVPNDTDLRQFILKEAHSSPYASVKILLWKWERVMMNFVSRLPLTPTKRDSVWVIVDGLTKSAHFILARIDYSLQKLAKLYISKIVRLYEAKALVHTDTDTELGKAQSLLMLKGA